MNSAQEQPQIIRLDETVSTNKYLRECLREERLPEGSVVLSEFQSGGRGQAGNHWESSPGKNLLFSVVLYPDCIPANRQFLISQIASLAVKETLDTYTDSITIKWPNDIYWKDRKICGMLIENDLTGRHIYCSIIGIGINLNQESFESNAPNPISLFQITGETYDKEKMLKKFLQSFYNYYLLLLQEKEESTREAYRKALYRGNGYHSFSDDNGSFEACIDDIALTGHLHLRLKDGKIRTYAFKEVSYK
ncbi:MULTISPECIES: biotin--[acetyl-CoA-carboxylase] ligase [unclassified Parabacteroides]|uniref:biotin--[acetyl-CoA-carboxylase] ligase n=1 Tax=unclassified Parabacteroides TaxID=2649774 RepID=UPI00247571E6|nr:MULTISPECIES: biotin--[acetyl-CoA-carboxylase] ligase [unclassified Parabacteroides]